MKNVLLVIGGIVIGMGACYFWFTWYFSKVFRQ